MTTLLIGAHAFLVIFAALGLGTALRAGIELGDLRAAYTAGIVGVILAGQMVIAVGGIWLHQAALREARGQFGYIAQALEEIGREKTRQLDHLAGELGEIKSLIEGQGDAFRELVDAAQNATTDELAERRSGPPDGTSV